MLSLLVLLLLSSLLLLSLSLSLLIPPRGGGVQRPRCLCKKHTSGEKDANKNRNYFSKMYNSEIIFREIRFRKCVILPKFFFDKFPFCSPSAPPERGTRRKYQLSKHRIRGRRAVFAAGLQNRG